MDHCENVKRKSNPRDRANICSLLTFTYTLGVIKKAYKKDLEEENLHDVLKECQSKKSGDRLERKWEQERKNNVSPSVFVLLWKAFGKEYLVIGFVQVFYRCLSLTIQADSLSNLVNYFKPDTKLTKYDAWYYASLIIGLIIIRGMYIHNIILYEQKFAMKIRTAFSSLIYRKSLRLSPAALEEVSLGNIVTIITKDVTAFENSIWFVNDMWLGVVELIYISYLLYYKMGPISFFGTSILIIVLPIQVLLAIILEKLRLGISQKTDERLQLMQEVLSFIKIIKMYTWEKFFNDKITKARKKELSKMLKAFYLKTIGICIGILSFRLGFFILIVTYSWLGYNTNAELVFYVLTCFGDLRDILAYDVPAGLFQAAELCATLKRINRVLNLEESTKIKNICTIKPCVRLKNVSVTVKDAAILKNISLCISTGLTLISGAIGSGKSSLVKTILKHYQIADGELVVKGRISYASQDAWLFPSSVRQNILFGEAFDKARYDEVLKVCALKLDIDLFDNGDETILSDKGNNLSKGQQSRISLARAVYKDSDIYLIDDSLAALDTNVQDYIFHNCIKGYLKDKIVILVTQNMKHILQGSKVVILENGKIPKDINIKDVLKMKNYVDENASVKNKEKNNKLKEEGIEESIEESVFKAEVAKKSKIYQEFKKSGNVSLDVYCKYIKFGGNIFVCIFIFLLYFCSAYSDNFSQVLLADWINSHERTQMYFKNESNSTSYYENLAKTNYKIHFYSGMILLCLILDLTKNYCLLNFARIASLNMHTAMSKSIIYASTSFHDKTFIGNIINRFSQDLNNIDEHIPQLIIQVFQGFFSIFGVLITLSYIRIIFLFPAIFFIIATAILKIIYMPAGRSLQRLEGTTRSPMIGHLNSSFEGLTTIHASDAQEILIFEFDKYQDLFTSAHFMTIATARALGFAIDIFCSLFTMYTVVSFMYINTGMDAAEIGLTLSLALSLTGQVQYGLRSLAAFENKMTSTERVLEYTKVEKESICGNILQNWPEIGYIQFQNVSLTYNNQEKVLKDLNFIVESKQKIGIVGRTGAGKSSIIATLFRLYEFEGSILIDNVDTKTLSLDFLRQSIAIIPQDPVLFSGNIRTNIDPMGNYTDQQIWEAIEKVKIKHLVPNLDLVINENGSSFSAGQKQLFCLARAIIRKNKIVVLDEATANMDPETDALLHDTIKHNFFDCTLFTIAHRLNTIMDSDKVMVLDRGKIVEFDSPKYLLRNKNTYFYKMINN